MRGFLACSLVVGCGAPSEIPKADFANAAADVICARTRECARGQFEAAYFGMSDCIAEWEVNLGLIVDLNDALDCAYDASEAAKAYTETAEMSCEDFYDGEHLTAADEIWGDCGGFTVTTTYGST